MKNILSLCVLLSSTCGLIGQRASLFTYDQAKVNSIMEQIDDESPLETPTLNEAINLENERSRRNLIPFVAGLTSSLLVGITGVFIISPQNWSKSTTLVTCIGLAGIITPPLAAGLITKDTRAAALAAAGLLPGCLIDILMLVIWYGAQY